MSNPQLPLCERFGFTAARIREHLALLDLGDKDYELAARLQQEVILPRFSAIINEFFAAVMQQPQAQAVLQDERRTKIVKKTITTFLLSLGSGFSSAKYFEHRLHVGLAHEAVGLSLSLYLCAWRGLTQAIINHFPDSLRNDPDALARMAGFLNKINALDMSLAIETYHNSHVQNLEDSIDTIQADAEKLRVQAITDSLTGMVNHEYIFGELEKRLIFAQKRQTPLCVLMVDLDHFKKVNDTYGHQAGDQVLVDVAKRIKSSLRDEDMVGRYGGEEFMVILHNTPLDIAKLVAERIRLRIADHPIISADLMLHVTASLGLATLVADDELKSLVKRADEALYEAKHGGRNQVVVREKK